MADGPEYVRASKVPERFGIPRSTLYRLFDRGELTKHKRGHLAFVKAEEVRNWIEGKEIAT